MPREAGAKMVVTREASHGTIGGGDLEFEALRFARAILRASGSRQLKSFLVGAGPGEEAGGSASLFFERVGAKAEWVRVLGAWYDAGEDCVVVVSANDEDDHRLLVRADGTWGSLGDEALDRDAIGIARAMLSGRNYAPQLVSLERPGGNPESVLLHRLRPSDFEVVLFGAGHVGRALVQVLGTVHCRVTWVDSRTAEFPPTVPDNVVVRSNPQLLSEVDRAHPGSYFLVMTHSHVIDFELVAAILRRGDFAYCGMIGSQTKRRTLEVGLSKHGIPQATLARFTCPIGVAGIQGKEPGTIAVAVAAQLIEVRETLSLKREPTTTHASAS